MSIRARSADAFIGHIVANRFEVEALIGSGGMGSVYRAQQRGLDRPVALKLLKDEASWDPDTVTRFHREAKAMSLLQHGNTVRVFDFGQTSDGTLFLAMELLEGETLTKRLQREGTLDPVHAIRTVQQVLRSLHEAHAKGIIHRDLKPDNIVLAAMDGQTEPVVKVLDFGIAKVFEGDNHFDQLETQAGTVFGTPRYMSPEQAQGKSLDARSDLYSVGVLLYQLITGVPPFQDEEAVVVMAKHIRDKPEPPIKAAPTRPISSSLNRAVLKALEKDPARRFQDALQFSSALGKCIPDIEVFKTTHTGIFGRAGRAPRAKAALGIAGGVLAVSLSVAAWVLYSYPEMATPDAPPERASPARAEVAPPVREEATLRTTPDGARVVADGELLGTTPFERSLAPGESLELALELDGFETVSTVLAAGEHRTVILTAEPAEADASRRRARSRAAARRRGQVAASAAPVAAAEQEAEVTMTVAAPVESATMVDDPYTRLDY